MEDQRILSAHERAADLERHVAMIAREFRSGFEAVDRIDRPAVTIFGSARVREGSAPYEQARAVAHAFARRRWAVVTGGGRGLGRSYALLLAAQGAKVVVNDSGGGIAGDGTNAVPADEVVREITASGGDTEIGHGLYPKPPDMRKEETQSLTDGEIFFIIRNGVRYTGMPAWGSGDPERDDDSWKLVDLIRQLPNLGEAEIAEIRRAMPKGADEESGHHHTHARGELSRACGVARIARGVASCAGESARKFVDRNG